MSARSPEVEVGPQEFRRSPTLTNWEMFEQVVKRQNCTPDEIATELARVFRMRYDEIAILQIHGKYLKFLCPFQLKHAGAIPLSSAAVAARTANTRLPELFNDFVRVQHLSVFEVISAKTASGSHVIQKLMTAPIIDGQEKVWGVIQVSRKGANCALAGPDFTLSDLEQLTLAARVVAQRM